MAIEVVTPQTTLENYRTENDDHGDEALFMIAIIHDGIVDFDWPHKEDDGPTYTRRWLAKVNAVANADTSSFSPQHAFLTMRLYRRGNVTVSCAAGNEGYQEQAIQLATEAALRMYDSVYPDVARLAQDFVEESI